VRKTARKKVHKPDFIIEKAKKKKTPDKEGCIKPLGTEERGETVPLPWGRPLEHHTTKLDI